MVKPKFTLSEIDEVVKLTSFKQHNITGFNELVDKRVKGIKSNCGVVSVKLAKTPDNAPDLQKEELLFFYKEILKKKGRTNLEKKQYAKTTLETEIVNMTLPGYDTFYPNFYAVFPDRNIYTMEYLKGESISEELSHVQSTLSTIITDHNKHKMLLNKKMDVIYEAIDLDSKFIKNGEGTQFLTIKPKSIDEETEVLFNDIIDIIAFDPRLSCCREKTPLKKRSAAKRYVWERKKIKLKDLKDTCRKFMGITVNGYASEDRKFLVHGEYIPNHIIRQDKIIDKFDQYLKSGPAKRKIVDSGDLRVDLEITDLISLIKNPLVLTRYYFLNDNPEEWSIGLLNYFLLRRAADSGKISPEEIEKNEIGLDGKYSMSEKNISLMKSIYKPEKIRKQIIYACAKDIRTSIGVLSVLRKYKKEVLEKYYINKIGENENMDRQDYMYEWHVSNLQNVFGFLLSSTGKKAYLGDNSRLINPIAKLRDVLDYIGIESGYKDKDVHKKLNLG